ncbi:MAG: hypothetical protein IPL84_14620 [Chitinophagaceae bacterium]|nr:hypothetical protein [Chitinophagaceae bacterium]
MNKFVAGIIVLAIAGGIYAYLEYNRKPADLKNKKAAAQVTAKELILLYTNYEDSANRKYLGKVVEVSGTIIRITNQPDSLVNILLGDSSLLSGVSCQIDSKHINETKMHRIGESLVIRGYCTGFLMDIELNRCVFVKQ